MHTKLLFPLILLYRGDGQVTGDVLVYRNPGLHFGDIHVLKATYLESIADFVGNAKYAIFFSAKGLRPMAKEIGDGDLDGDMYWVSKNPKVINKISVRFSVKYHMGWLSFPDILYLTYYRLTYGIF